MNIIKREYKSLIKGLKDQYNIYRSGIERRRAVKLAKYLSAENDGRKFVVYRQSDGVYKVFDRDQFKELRRKRRGSFPPDTTWQDIIYGCVFETARIHK